MLFSLLASIVVSTNCVSFTARATGIDTSVPVEFILVGPDSDRDYEALFVADDPFADVAAAFRRAGIPAGKTSDASRCILWPVGSIIELEPRPESLLKLCQGDDYRFPDTVYTGGNGNSDMPLALFATYTCGQSLLTFDDSLDQSLVYGRFLPARKWRKGDTVTFKATWKGGRTFDTTPDFPADKTLDEAVKYAKALQLSDSRTHKINGFRDGQFFYQAFLPKAEWRDRMRRPSQPVEVRVTATNVVTTVIDEDWSNPEPEFTPRVVDFVKAFSEKAVKSNTVFFFAPGDTKLGRLYELRRMIPASFANFYVYID